MNIALLKYCKRLIDRARRECMKPLTALACSLAFMAGFNEWNKATKQAVVTPATEWVNDNGEPTFDKLDNWIDNLIKDERSKANCN